MKVVLKLGTTMNDFYNWLSEFHTPNLKPQILNMSRIVDVEESFSGLEIDSEGEVTIRITDEILTENEGVYSFKVKDGKLSVVRVEKEPSVTLTIEGATSLLYGTLDEEHMRHLGWLEGEDAGVIFDWFSREIPWLTEEF
jgi:predicted acetyltransferase